MKKNVLLVYTEKVAFVREDIITLRKLSHLTEYTFKPLKNPILLFFQFIKQFFSLVRNIKNYDVLYIWFADYHSFLPICFSLFFKKKSIIILGGYDTMSLPSINYGVFIKDNLRKTLIKFAIKNANYLLGVDESMFTSTNSYIEPQGIKVGVNNFVDNIKGKSLVVPTGYNVKDWTRDNKILKENIIVTIGSVTQEKGLKRKGFDFFKEVAKHLPNYQFVIIGPNKTFKEILEKDAPANLTVKSFMPQEEFKKTLNKAKVFCQFSLAEGLPNTLCEAMLYECIPVGSSVNGIPKAIGNTNLIISQPEIGQAKKAIEYAIKMSSTDGTHFRNRIISLFPKKNREQALKAII